MLAAIRTGLGKTPGSRLIALGTKPANPQHWFTRLLDGGAMYSQTHAAHPNDPKFQHRTWRKANPSLDHLPSLLAEIRSEAADARRDPAMLAAFDSLRLNLGVSDVAEQVLLDAGPWERIEGPGVRLGPYVLGVALGGAALHGGLPAPPGAGAAGADGGRAAAGGREARQTSTRAYASPAYGSQS